MVKIKTELDDITIPSSAANVALARLWLNISGE